MYAVRFNVIQQPYVRPSFARSSSAYLRAQREAPRAVTERPGVRHSLSTAFDGADILAMPTNVIRLPRRDLERVELFVITLRS